MLDRGVYVRVGSTNRRADRELIDELRRLITDEVGQTLFEIEWLLDTADVSGTVFDPDKHRPS